MSCTADICTHSFSTWYKLYLLWAPLLAWLQPQCLCYASCFCQRSSSGSSGCRTEHRHNFSQRRHTNTHPHWHQGWLAGERSRQLDLKARITGQKTLRCNHTHKYPSAHTCRHAVVNSMEGLLSCVSWPWAFLQGSFLFGFPQHETPTVVCGCCGHQLNVMCLESPAELKWVVGKEWLPKVNKSCKRKESNHKSTFMLCTVKVQWDEADTSV